jgi:hypothetical protein
MASKEQPLKIILSLLGSLSAADHKKLRQRLEIAEPEPCVRLGHSYKTIPVGGGLFTPPSQKLVCTKCGRVEIL